MNIREGMNRRHFNNALAGLGAAASLAPFGIVRAQSSKLKIGVLLPRSGAQALIGQSCQRGADISPALMKKLFGVDIEVMHGDTESNTDVARSRAERLIQEGAHVLVGAYDSGHTTAIAQVAEQRGVPFIINVAAAPQITEQGYKFVFRVFITVPELLGQALSMMGDLFRATKVVPRTAVFMHVNDTFGQAMAGGVRAFMPRVTHLPFKIVDTIPYDYNAKDLTVEISKAKSANPDFLMVATRLNDAIMLRREMVKQRFNTMGLISPGSPGIYEEQFSKVLGRHANYCVTNLPWFNPKTELTKMVQGAFAKQYPKDKFVYHGLNAGYTFEAIMVAADAFRRARSTDPTTLAEAIRQTNIAERIGLGGPIKFNAKGQIEGSLAACLQIHEGVPRVLFPTEAAEAKPVFPWPEYKRA